MNWLAHLYLSEPDAKFRIGNLLPDLALRSHLASLPEPYQKGIRCHRRIDVFTDTHARVHACVRRFPAPYRRYGGILTDIYFDHFLARDWSKYSTIPFDEFLRQFYRDIEICLPEIPPETVLPLLRMRDENWLASYHTIEGIADILHRVSYRFRRPFDLTGSIPMFEEHESAFLEDFQAFFPELTKHLDGEI
jgi:acyl carrier protein phosphodiesterase